MFVTPNKDETVCGVTRSEIVELNPIDRIDPTLRGWYDEGMYISKPGLL